MSAEDNLKTCIANMSTDKPLNVLGDLIVGAVDLAVVLDEVDRLRSEIELMRDAEYRRSDRYRRLGDDLARAAFTHLDHVPGSATGGHTTAERLNRAAQAWRQADA